MKNKLTYKRATQRSNQSRLCLIKMPVKLWVSLQMCQTTNPNPLDLCYSSQLHTHTRPSIYRENASSCPIKGDAVHRRQVSQNPLVHLHVLVHSRGHQLPQTVRAVEPAAEARLHYSRDGDFITVTNICHIHHIDIRVYFCMRRVYRYWVGCRRWWAAQAVGHSAAQPALSPSTQHVCNLETDDRQ